MLTIQSLMITLLLIAVVLFVIAVVEDNKHDDVSFSSMMAVMILLPFDLNLYLIHLAFKDIPIIIAVVLACFLLIVEGITIKAFTDP